jgi:hypothetical protein
VKPQDHAIVFTWEEEKKKGKAKKKEEKAKPPIPKEEKGESKLRKTPIRIIPQSPRDKLDPCSRLNYAKIYTVEHNVKVCFIGDVHEDSVKYLTRDYNLLHQALPEQVDVEFSDDNYDDISYDQDQSGQSGQSYAPANNRIEGPAGGYQD